MRIASVGMLGSLALAASALGQTPQASGPALKQLPPVSRPATLSANQKSVDPETLAQYVLFQTAHDAQDDLKALMTEVKASNERKEVIRNGAPRRPSNPCQGSEAADWRTCLDGISARLGKARAGDADRAALDVELSALKRELDETGQSKTADIRTIKLQASQKRAAQVDAILARLGKRPPP